MSLSNRIDHNTAQTGDDLIQFVNGKLFPYLHGIEAPNIIHTNTLAENLADVQEKDRFDIIVANPPFGVKTVVLFFEKGTKTRKVWFYQLDPSTSSGQARNLGKTNPLNDADLAEFIALQKTFADSPKSWSVDVRSLSAAEGWDLSVKNPNGNEAIAHRSPQEIMDEIAALDAESAAVLANIRGLL